MKRLAYCAIGALALTSFGCSFDVFHDTSWPTACEIDPDGPGCGDAAAEAGPDAAPDAAPDVAPDAAAE